MKAFNWIFSTAILLICLGLAAPTIAQDSPQPWLTTTPNPPPADQEFPAVFHIRVNPATSGFWDEHPPSTINGNVITFLFDMGCGFLCPPGEPAYMAYPFTMPALPAGTHVIRFANGLDVHSEVFAEFTIDVGLGGITSTALPIGGGASVLLGLCILLLGWRHLRVNSDVDERGV